MQTQHTQGPQVVIGGQPISLQNIPSNQQVIIINNVKDKDIQLQTNYSLVKVKIFGGLQIFAGAMSFILNVVAATINYNWAWKMAAGFWAAPFFVAAGAFAIASTRIRTKPMIDSTLAFSILSALLAIPLIAQCGLSFGYGQPWSSRKSYVGVNGTLTVFAIGELAFAVAQSILCCAATCKCCRYLNEGISNNNNQPHQTQYVYYNPEMTSGQQPQLQQIPQQQTVQYGQQPMQQHQFSQQQPVPNQQQPMQQQQFIQQPVPPPYHVQAPSAPHDEETKGAAGGMDLPPAYEELENGQDNLDAKINDWAQRELHLGKS